MTIREIARLTGLAPATVARMKKDPSSVKLSTRTRIENILKNIDKGYSINLTFVERLVLIIPTLNNNFFIEFFYGVSEYAFKNNIPVEIYLSHEKISIEKEIFSNISDYKRTGVLWIPAAGKRESPVFDPNHGLLIAIADRDLDIEGVSLKILCDNFQASKKAGELLLAEGVKSPIIITGDTNLKNSQERRNGFLSALAANNISDLNKRVFYADFNNDSSIESVFQKIMESDFSIDGILAANNILGLGVLKYAKKYHFSIPKKIKLITFDHIKTHMISEIPLTEVVFPAYDIGVKAAEIILGQGGRNPSLQKYYFSAQIYFTISSNETLSKNLDK